MITFTLVRLMLVSSINFSLSTYRKCKLKASGEIHWLLMFIFSKNEFIAIFEASRAARRGCNFNELPAILLGLLDFIRNDM